MINSQDICDSINEFFKCLYENNLILNYRPHNFSHSDGIIEFSTRDVKGDNRQHNKYTYISEYIGALRDGDYSLLLNDGGIIQISFKCDETEIKKYRFAYLPCPARCLENDYKERRDRMGDRDGEYEQDELKEKNECMQEQSEDDYDDRRQKDSEDYYNRKYYIADKIANVQNFLIR